MLYVWVVASFGIPGLPGAEAACLPPPTGLMHWWPGDGTNQDIEGGKDGTLQGGATFAPGLVEQAFHFNGIDGFVNVAHDSSLNFGTRDFTVDLWVRFADLSGEQILIEKYIETEPAFTGIPREGWTFTKLVDNTLRLAGPTQSGVGSIIDASPPEPLVSDTWYLVAVTRQGDTFTLYWNGVPLGSAEATVNLDTGASLKIGHRGNPNDTPGSVDERGFYLNGYADEVEIFNRALSAAEITAIFQAGSRGKCKSTPIKVIAQIPFLQLLLGD